LTMLGDVSISQLSLAETAQHIMRSKELCHLEQTSTNGCYHT
jgi:hypothetical protein